MDFLDGGHFYTKPKPINFAKFKRTRTPERLVLLQNILFSLFFPERPKCPEQQKQLQYSFFHTNPQNQSFLGLESKNPDWEALGI